MVFILNSAMSQEQQYSPEMIATCLKLSEGIDTSEWLIDENLPVLEDSNLDKLDDGWNKAIKQSQEKMLVICSANEKSDECILAKSAERKLRKERYSCYYAVLMRAI
jgi:hypothetical protein